MWTMKNTEKNPWKEICAVRGAGTPDCSAVAPLKPNAEVQWHFNEIFRNQNS